MNTTKNMGIWMDHSTAQFIDMKEINNQTINSDFTFNTKEEALSRSENLMHNKRQQIQQAFYKEIAQEVLNYNHVILFGPTNAKLELHNYLNKDDHFKDILIDVVPADQMSENEKKAFVKNHFENIKN